MSLASQLGHFSYQLGNFASQLGNFSKLRIPLRSVNSAHLGPPLVFVAYSCTPGTHPTLTLYGPWPARVVSGPGQSYQVLENSETQNARRPVYCVNFRTSTHCESLQTRTAPNASAPTAFRSNRASLQPRQTPTASPLQSQINSTVFNPTSVRHSPLWLTRVRQALTLH